MEKPSHKTYIHQRSLHQYPLIRRSTDGGALLKDIDRLLSEETGLPVLIADDPMTCVARGGGHVLEALDEKGTASFSLE